MAPWPSGHGYRTLDVMVSKSFQWIVTTDPTITLMEALKLE